MVVEAFLEGGKIVAIATLNFFLFLIFRHQFVSIRWVYCKYRY